MLDVAFVGLTVLFFIAVALVGAGADRLGRRDRNSGPEARS